MATPKPPHPNSLAAQRQLVEMAKTMDLETIAKKTGRKPEGILRTAKRLRITINGQKAK